MTSSIIRGIIADDEQHCLANLQHYIKKYCPQVEIVGTSANMYDVPQLIAEHRPDVAFLDIEMCNNNIFEVLDEIDVKPAIVFVTAYERYAIKAVKIQALDYVLKPLSKDEILSCYQKIIDHMQQKQAQEAQRPKEKEEPKKVILRHGEHVFVVKQSDIHYLKAKGFYTEVCFDFKGTERTSIVSKPISVLEKEYDGELFFRLHKSYLVNKCSVDRLLKGETTSVKMHNGSILPVAKRRVKDFLLFLNGAG